MAKASSIIPIGSTEAGAGLMVVGAGVIGSAFVADAVPGAVPGMNSSALMMGGATLMGIGAALSVV